MKKIVLFAFAILFAAVAVKSLLEQQTNTALGGAIVAAVFAFFAMRGKKGKAAGSSEKQPAPTAKQQMAPVAKPVKAPAAAVHGSVTFRVAGVTFENDDGTSRQTILRRMKFNDEPFESWSEIDLDFARYTYNGDPAMAIEVRGETIGNVPAAEVANVTAALQRPGAHVASAEVIGGGTYDGERINYGMEITIIY